MSALVKKPALVRRSVVELDLVGYTLVARAMEQQTDALALHYLNEQVQSFVDDGLREAGCVRKDVVNGTAGDNALLVFERASEAHRFSEAVHRATVKHNATKTDVAAHRHFRIGISTGEIAVRGREISGTRIIDSVRLEAAGKSGHILVDEATYEELPARFQQCYRGPESVADKQNNIYDVYRFVVVKHDSFKHDVEALGTRYIPPHKAPPPTKDVLGEDCVVSPTHVYYGVDQAFYLFASPTAIPDASSATSFYEVNGESLAKSLCGLFTREYTDTDGLPTFHYKAAVEITMEERVLLDESLELLAGYDDPDPGIYDPPRSSNALFLAQYARQAKKWEPFLDKYLHGEDQGNTPENTEPSISDMPKTDELPKMSVEDRRNSGLNLLILLAQAYFKMLECTISLASWCTVLDLELNQSYFWTVTSITNLLKNHEDLKDFPTTFQPLFPDLYPSTIRDLDWEDMVAPDAERYLSTVQQYVLSKGIYVPEERSDAWVFIEIFRPAVNIAIERAEAYFKRMQQYRQRILSSSPLPRTTSSSIEGKQTMKKTVVELDLVGYSTICDNIEQGLDVNSVPQLNQQIQSFVDAGLNVTKTLRNESVMHTTGDGAILVFDSAADAHRFAQAVHEATREHNEQRKQLLAKRVFRIGAATGDIVMQSKPGGGFDIAGMTIARAVRLEAAAKPGGLLVDEATFEALALEQMRQYGSKQRVSGKRDEQFEAYFSQLNADGPEDATFFTRQGKIESESEVATREFGRNKRRQILTLFKGLKSHQYADLIFLIEVPIGQRPTDTLNLDQQKAQVLKWADENAELDSLLEALAELTELENKDRP